MEIHLSPGLVRKEIIRVDSGRCVQFLGADSQVYSTPDMISDVEYACLRLIDEHLDASQSSLGVRVSLEHLAATPCGEQVEVQVRIERVEGARVYLSAEVRDRIELLGRGEHVRHVIDRRRLARGLDSKRRKLQESATETPDV